MLKTQLQTLNDELTSQLALYQEVNAAQASKLAQVTADLARMTDLKQAAQAERNNRDEEAQNLFDQVWDLKAQKAEVEAQVARLQSDLAEEKADNKQVAQSWFEAFEQNQALKAELAEVKAELEDVYKSRHDLAQRSLQNSEDAAYWREQTMTLRQEVKGLRYVRDGLYEDLDKAQELAALRAMDVARLTQQVNEYTEDKRVLYECFKDTQQDLDDLRASLADEKDQAQALADSLRDMTSLREDALEALETLGASHRSLQLQVFDLQTVVNLQKTIKARLQSDLAQAQREGGR